MPTKRLWCRRARRNQTGRHGPSSGVYRQLTNNGASLPDDDLAKQPRTFPPARWGSRSSATSSSMSSSSASPCFTAVRRQTSRFSVNMRAAVCEGTCNSTTWPPNGRRRAPTKSEPPSVPTIWPASSTYARSGPEQSFGAAPEALPGRPKDLQHPVTTEQHAVVVRHGHKPRSAVLRRGRATRTTLVSVEGSPRFLDSPERSV